MNDKENEPGGLYLCLIAIYRESPSYSRQARSCIWEGEETTGTLALDSLNPQQPASATSYTHTHTASTIYDANYLELLSFDHNS